MTLPLVLRCSNRVRTMLASANGCLVIAALTFPSNTDRMSAHLSEALAQFGDEQLGLLKRGEMTTFRNLVPVEEPRIGLIAPHLRRCEKVAFEDTHCNRQ